MKTMYRRLFKYRTREKRAPLEDFLTEALADLIDRMPSEIAADLFATMLEPTGEAERWRDALRSSKRACSTQLIVEGGIADLVVSLGGRPAIVVESKIGSPIRVHEIGALAGGHQLRTYDRWLGRERKPGGGAALILLTQSTSAPSDFLDNGAYHVEDRAVFTWGNLARWLRRQRTDHGGGTNPTWLDLAIDLHAFLEEQGMSNDTVTASDISAAQLFLPAWQRWENTFEQLWAALAESKPAFSGSRSRCSSRPRETSYGNGRVAQHPIPPTGGWRS